MKKIDKFTYLKHKKELQALYKLGKQHDKEKDPEKKALLEQQVIAKCNELKEKMNLKDCSDEETNALLGISTPSK